MLSKCSHDVYLPAWAVDGQNPYCSGCSTFGRVPNPQNVVLPTASNDPLSNKGRLMANKRGNLTGCPACQSSIYVLRSNNLTDRSCGDCGENYKVRLSLKQRAEMIRVEAEEQEDE